MINWHTPELKVWNVHNWNDAILNSASWMDNILQCSFNQWISSAFQEINQELKGWRFSAYHNFYIYNYSAFQKQIRKIYLVYLYYDNVENWVTMFALKISRSQICHRIGWFYVHFRHFVVGTNATGNHSGYSCFLMWTWKSHRNLVLWQPSVGYYLC